MADIFLSYSRSDKPRVAPLVAALEGRGWSVWWDMALAPGEEFDAVTGAALESARSVVVVWTPTSVASRWVRGEARVGADRNVLVPVRFEAATLPIDLRAIQTTDMDDWGGDPKSAPFQTLHQSLSAMLGAPAKDGAPLVGRARELERLRDLLTRAGRSEGGFVLFSGEAGIGKTRMTLEADQLAQDSGFAVLRGHCSNMESAPPYQPALEQIEQNARQLGPELMRRSMGENAPEICRLMPELLQRYTDIPAYPALPPEQERRYLLHGIAEFVARGAQRQPLMLVFEDLHWAEESTCILLTYVAERLKNERVLLVGTYRDSDLTSDAPFARTLQDLVRKHLAEDWRLGRLSTAEIADLMSRQYGSAPPAPLIELIYSKTEGNPFFVDEVLRHLNESGKLLTELGKFSETIQVTDAELTRGVRLIIEDRIGLAGADCREVLTMAAVMGRTFTFDLLANTDAKRDEDAILDAIEEAERKHLIEDISVDRVARYRFVHEQIRQTMLSGLSLPRRQRLHLRIAHALERMGNVDRNVSEIAHHLYQAGSAADPARTAQRLSAAGERDVRALAFEDGLGKLDRALTVLDDGGDASARGRLHELRAEALRGAERIPEALEALARAAALAATPAEKDDVNLKRCRMLLDIWRGGEAVTDLEGLLERAKASGDSARELDVQSVLARAYYVKSLDHREFAQKCRDAYERAIELARTLANMKSLAASLVATANLTDYWRDYRRQAITNLAEAEAIAKEIGDEDVSLDAATSRLSLLFTGSDGADEEAMLERLLARRDPIRLNNFYFRMMWSTLSRGRLERCVEICDAGIALAYRIGTLPVQYPTIKAFALLELGRIDDAKHSLSKEISDEAHRFGAALRAMGELFVEIRIGAYDVALERAPEVIAQAHAVTRVWMLQWIASELAALAPFFAGDVATVARIEALVASTQAGLGDDEKAAFALAHGDADPARQLLEREGTPTRPTTMRVILGRRLLRAHAELAAGDAQAALATLESAIGLAQEKGAKGTLWRLLAEQALALEAAGDGEAGGKSRAAALAIWSDIGGAIADPEHRAVFLRGPLAQRLNLAKVG